MLLLIWQEVELRQQQFEWCGAAVNTGNASRHWPATTSCGAPQFQNRLVLIYGREYRTLS